MKVRLMRKMKKLSHQTIPLLLQQTKEAPVVIID